jgi:twitching motility protein PilT
MALTKSKSDLEGYLARLLAIGGSDLHLKAGAPPCVRVDGVLRRLPDAPRLSPEELDQLAAAAMSPPVGARFATTSDIDFAYSSRNLARFRVNAFRQRGSVSLVLRAIPTEPRSVEELGLPHVIAAMGCRHRGLLLATGPTGSGKSSTLAAIVNQINEARECHILTIEDPIEMLHRDRRAIVNQREIGEDALSFPTALRAAMREDPDVILVGEMRDAETVEVALAAAETGHLVLSTLHTIDAAETVNRIVGFFPPHQRDQIRLTLSGTLVGTICQRLVRRRGGGRIPAVEVMVANERVRKWIIDPEWADVQEIIASSEFDGSQSFEASLIGLLRDGLVDLEDAMSASSNAHSLRVRMRELGLLRRHQTVVSTPPTAPSVPPG